MKVAPSIFVGCIIGLLFLSCLSNDGRIKSIEARLDTLSKSLDIQSGIVLGEGISITTNADGSVTIWGRSEESK